MSHSQQRTPQVRRQPGRLGSSVGAGEMSHTRRESLELGATLGAVTVSFWGGASTVEQAR